MINVENTLLEASDVYEKLYNIQLSNNFLSDRMVDMIVEYWKKGDSSLCADPNGAYILYSLINKELNEVIEIFNVYNKE